MWMPDLSWVLIAEDSAAPMNCSEHCASDSQWLINYRYLHSLQVCVQLPMYADNITLPAFARCCCAPDSNWLIAPVKPKAVGLLLWALAGTDKCCTVTQTLLRIQCRQCRWNRVLIILLSRLRLGLPGIRYLTRPSSLFGTRSSWQFHSKIGQLKARYFIRYSF